MTAAGAAADRGCALVTGASRGIGAAVARALAADGWPVAVNYRSGGDAAEGVVREIRAAGGQAVAIEADVSASEAPEMLVGGAERELGRPLLVLVNNAGVTANGLAAQMDDEVWQRSIDVNLTAAFRLTRRALESMLAARFGRVVNVGSLAGYRPVAGQANYAAAKAGLVGMTKAVAVEVARRSVTVNAVAPGIVDTEMAAEVPKAFVAAIPAGRLGTPDEVAAYVRFLATEQAGYVTGTVLAIDGGLHA
jgi:3-oxoacyl-[acyl-carrier protein] reductase